MKYEFNLSLEELEKRTNKDYLATKKLLTPESSEYLNLKDGDKTALKYLVKAGDILEKINMQLDNKENLPFKKFIDDEIKKGNKQAELTKILFDAQKGICALDRESNKIELVKGVKELPGKGLYPTDLSKDEFHNILIKMLKSGKVEEVRKILNQRSVIERDGDELKATDYIDYFKEDFAKIAEFLDKASEVSTDSDFNEYLKLQAKAFRGADPMLDAYADKKWATLEETPLEFTITRENYADEMTESAIECPELKKMLDENKIEVISKDFLGARIGIVNKEGTEYLFQIKKYLPLLAYNMPFKDEYEQNIKPENKIMDEGPKSSKQTMVDVDLVQVNGDVGEYRAGITLAENLPNDDKLSLTIGGGRRNVYHRQIRFISDYKKLQKRLNTLLDKEQHKYYLNDADHWFTIGHENTHSLGPNKGTEALGKYKSIIEENKADMGALAMLDVLQKNGMYTKEQVEQIVVTFAADNFLKSKPTLSQAHRVRSVMQNKYLLEHGAVELTKDGKIHVNIDKMVPTAKKMLSEIVRVQIDGDFKKGEKYVLDNFVWTDEMEKLAIKMREIDKNLNGRVEAKLAEKLLK
ncbi:MAG: hypothetical protein LKG27_03085 [Clostridiaceae bacterium]|jgi:hypothetical protein|nr:hypothetical protein [Clostridiaceae bacterium]